MSSFDFFDEPQKESNLEEVMKKIDDHSLDFDQFDPIQTGENNDNSFASDFFATGPKPTEQPPVPAAPLQQSAKSQGKNQSFDL